jgi:Arc/MetJ-type ribon-helix-helix transcriptional regulator
MKVKTSVRLSKEAVAAIDRLAGKSKTRSEVVETAVRELAAAQARRERYCREVELIDRHSNELNREAEDVLAFQAEL